MSPKIKTKNNLKFRWDSQATSSRLWNDSYRRLGVS